MQKTTPTPIEFAGGNQNIDHVFPAPIPQNTNLSDAQKAISQFGKEVLQSSKNIQQKKFELVPNKLDTSEIFEIIRKNICLISGGCTRGTGVLHDGLIITSFHVIEKEIRQGITFETNENGLVEIEYKATTEKIHAEFQKKIHDVYFRIPTYEYDTMPLKTADVNYLPNVSEETQEGQNVVRQCIDNYFEKCRKLDLIALQAPTIQNVNNNFKIIDDSFILREGMKVYFGGYPFSQNSITFGKGLISSIEKDSETGVQHFIIDGTSVAGNSGSPVFIQYQGNVYLVGIVVAQIANWGKDLNKTFAWMKYF